MYHRGCFYAFIGRVDVVGVGGWSFSYIAFARLPSQGKVTPTPPYLGLSTDLLLEP